MVRALMDDLLVTKLHIPPARKNLVQRPQLVQQLTEEWQQGKKLSLVSAPAGYGKTTLITEWLATITHFPSPFGREGKVGAAWLSLEEADNDPILFLSYLIAALEQASGRMFENTRAMLQTTQPLPPEVVMKDCINAIVPISDAIVVVLDDYHVIHNAAIHHILTFLLEHQPAQIHLALLTREDPLLPISRWRARGQVMELRQDDLRFTVDECAEFLQLIMGIPLSKEDVAALERRTEGWIVGLQLAALSMRGRSDLTDFIQAFTGSNRFVLDFLVDEVFKRQTTEVQDFLLKTSILERLSAAVCNAVAEKTNSQELLERLEQANMFIVPLDQSRAWYRYHHLFSELLSHRLRGLGRPVVALLHQRASLWFEAANYLAEAIHHALEAEDWDRSAELIEQAGNALLKRGELVTLIGWCEKLPAGMITARPSLGISYAWAHSLLGQYEKADSILLEIEEMAESIPPLLGQVASAQAYTARGIGDNPRAIAKSKQALALLAVSDAQARSLVALNLGLVYWHEGQLHEATQILSEVESAARQTGNLYALLTAQIFIARTLASQGELRRAERIYQQILREGGQVPILALAHYDLSGIYYEWNELVKAGEHLDKGLDLCTRSGNLEFQNTGHLLKALLLLAYGKKAEALAEMEQSHTLARELNPATQARSAACHAQIALAMGDEAGAEQWVEKMSVDVDAHPFYRFIGLTRPRLWIAQGRKVPARELLNEYAHRAVEAGWGYAQVAIRILQSLAAENQEIALVLLKETLPHAQAEGYLRTFIDTGRALVPLLQESARRGVAPVYVGQILEAFGEGHKKSTIPTFSLVEPLSGRELEVLRLVTAGHSNREIARLLVISPGTAKTHIHNICGKLGARNRTEAVSRAKELHLV